MIPIQFIYSYWVLALTFLWSTGLLPFSPLASAIPALIGTVYLTVRYQIPFVVLLAHVIPVWILRNTHTDLPQNLAVFALYNLFLHASGTSFIKVYTEITNNPPKTIDEYLKQRGFKI